MKLLERNATLEGKLSLLFYVTAVNNGCREEASAQKNKNWGCYETKCQNDIWADDEEIQLQLSAIAELLEYSR